VHFSAPGLQRPGYGLGGWPGWRSDRRRTERSAAQRSDLQAGQFAKRASFTRSVKEQRPAIPGARERAATCFSRLRRPDRVASGMEARQGRDAGTSVARRAAQQPDPAQRGDARAHRDLASVTPQHPSPEPASADLTTALQTWLAVDPLCASNFGYDAPFTESSLTTPSSIRRANATSTDDSAAPAPRNDFSDRHNDAGLVGRLSPSLSNPVRPLSVWSRSLSVLHRSTDSCLPCHAQLRRSSPCPGRLRLGPFLHASSSRPCSPKLA
jgi:hypothetical protein